jgi:hypothetical protein
VLRYSHGRATVKVVGVAKGSKVTLTCSKRACKSVKKTAGKSKFALLSNRKVKKGTTIVVRISATGYAGKQLVWRAGGAKRVSCMNPGSTKARKPGTCNG